MKNIKLAAIAGLIYGGLTIGLVSCGTTRVSSSNPIATAKIPSPAPVETVTNPLPVITTTSPSPTTVTAAPTTVINEQGQVEWVGLTPQGLTAKDCSNSSEPMSQKQSNSQICRSLIASNTAVDLGFHNRMVKMTAESQSSDNDYYQRMSEINREAAAARIKLAQEQSARYDRYSQELQADNAEITRRVEATRAELGIVRKQTDRN